MLDATAKPGVAMAGGVVAPARPDVPRLAARALAGLAGAATFAALFATWSRMNQHQFAIVAVSTTGSLGNLAVSHDAWGTYAGAAAGLAVVAALIVGAAVSDRPRLLAVAALAAVGALVFTLIQLISPPVLLPGRVADGLPVALPTSLGSLGSGGLGETVATSALAVAAAGLLARIALGVRAGRAR